MFVFTSDEFIGELIQCNEGDLEWINKERVNQLNTWEGDKIFVEKLQKENGFFTVKFEYDDNTLVRYVVKDY